MDSQFVKENYNKIAQNYSKNRDSFNNLKHLERLNSLLKPNSTVLDIGCGAGIPIDQYFIDKGHQMIGIDISEKQIEFAKKNLPSGSFEVKDMTRLKKNEYNVDAVVSFYAIFHTPKEQHLEILKNISSFLKNGGFLLITMGASEWEGTEDFHGGKMFWSHFAPEKNLVLLKDAGFEIIESIVDTSGNEKHQVILGRKV